MQSNHDWFPGKRDKMIEMATVWQNVIPAHAAWGVPAAEITALASACDEAQNSWAEEEDPATKTPVIVEHTRAAFRALEVKMRYIKRHWLIAPPLLPEDMTALMLPAPDAEPTAIPAPTVQAEADLSFPGVHMVLLSHFRPVNAQHSPNPKSDYGIAVHYGLTGSPTETHPIRLSEPPVSGKQLADYHFVTDGKMLLDLDGESGNTIYISLTYENQKGQMGPMSPVIKAVIP
jgi:hypothetical protein